jgi:hypothetical protein
MKQRRGRSAYQSGLAAEDQAARIFRTGAPNCSPGDIAMLAEKST